ncbi:Catenin delta-1 [Saguinus oedipus]|uniref:Catenin delta-1 n=1 Tax=Saguinus oedipus TaxID=9490 RepID=A0ABQ9UIC2_SAGOE|nr:Catenin delta-1 [Saguinus oedipus]
MDHSELELTASIFASVKEQEAQFEKLTRALEEEWCHVSVQLECVRVSPQDANPRGQRHTHPPASGSQSPSV